ncbi:hypothetical protein NN561_018410 [Cricetulus griseus]
MLLSLRACLPATSRPQGKLQVFQHLSFSEQADGFSGPDQGIQTQDVGCIISSPDVQPSAQQTAPATPAAGTLIPPPPPRRPRRPLPTAPPAAVPALLRAGSLQLLRNMQLPNGVTYHIGTYQDWLTKLQDRLRQLSILFRKLKLVDDKCNENCGGMGLIPVEQLIPYVDEDGWL